MAKSRCAQCKGKGESRQVIHKVNGGTKVKKVRCAGCKGRGHFRV